MWKSQRESRAGLREGDGENESSLVSDRGLRGLVFHLVFSDHLRNGKRQKGEEMKEVVKQIAVFVLVAAVAVAASILIYKWVDSLPIPDWMKLAIILDK